MKRSTGLDHRALLEVIEEARGLLTERPDESTLAELEAPPLPSLLEQCHELLDEALQAEQAEPIRLLMHFACTGGSLISKVLAACPNVRLLSEVNPMAHYPRAGTTVTYAPSDIILLLQRSLRPVDDTCLSAVFLAAVSELHDQCKARGEHLVLRDHPHSHYCIGESVSGRPRLRSLVERIATVRAAVTVRHPLDSYLSLGVNNWYHFRPETLEEYARRYNAFLDDNADLPLFHYETLVAEPAKGFSELAGILDLRFDKSVLDLIDIVPMSGDSGRSGPHIKKRSRREMPAEVAAQVDVSPSYAALCVRLGYVSRLGS